MPKKDLPVYEIIPCSLPGLEAMITFGGDTFAAVPKHADAQLFIALMQLCGVSLAALRPFADYADPRRLAPRDMSITAGSGLAKRQLKMNDCYAAAAVIARADALGDNLK